MPLTIPTVSWAGYNLFRLVAVGVMAWTLVVQFISLSRDMKVYSTEAGQSTSSSGSKWGEEGEGEGQIVGSSYYGDSAIPNQPGGPFAAVTSRLIYSIALSVMIAAQLGVPEETFYRHVSWLGPQGSPLALGLSQMIVAILTLSMHAEEDVLSASWALMSIGLTNIVLAIVLLMFRRRRGGDPRFFLKFAKHHRLQFWTPPPRFYSSPQIHPSHSNGSSQSSSSNDIEKQGLKATKPDKEARLEVTVDDGQDEEGIITDIRLGIPKKIPRVRPTIQHTDHTDVSKGGYPTFSGQGLTTPGRNVPSGQVEETLNGSVQFVREEQQQVQSQRPLAPAPTHNRQEPEPLIQPPSQNKERPRPKPSPLQLGRPGPKLSLPPKRQPSRRSTAPLNIIKDHKKSKILSKSIASVPSLTPIGEDEPGSALTIKSTSGQSGRLAAIDLAPRFPLPPSRMGSLDPQIREVAVSGEMSKVKAKRESSMDTLPTQLSVQAISEVSGTDLKSPSSVDVSSAPSKEDRTISSASPHHPDLTPPIAPQTPVDSPRTQAAAAKSARISKGVRFDISSPQVNILSPETSTTATSSVATLPSATIQSASITKSWRNTLFGALTPTRSPAKRSDSLDSAISERSAARPESMASTASFHSQGSDDDMRRKVSVDDIGIGIGRSRRMSSVDEKAGLPRRKGSLASSITSVPDSEVYDGLRKISRPKSFA